MTKKGTSPTSILLADECALFHDGFRLMLESQGEKEIKLVDVAFTGNQLLEKVKRHKPDVVITTNHLKEMDAMSACKMIKLKHPKTCILSITSNNEEDLLYKLLATGADGFISKSECKDHIINAIKTVASGIHYYCASISGKVLDLISKKELENKRRPEILFTNQELKVIELICKQYTTKEIASAMRLCSRTVEEYRTRIQEKMGAKNVAGMVVYVFKHNLLSSNNT